MSVHHHSGKAFNFIVLSFFLCGFGRIDFTFIDVLSRRSGTAAARGVPNLERYLESHPELFVQAIVWAFNRSDGQNDPEEWRVASDQLEHFARQGRSLLHGLADVPGRDEFGEVRSNLLATWVKAVRDALADLGRLEIGDIHIGQLLAGAPAGPMVYGLARLYDR